MKNNLDIKLPTPAKNSGLENNSDKRKQKQDKGLIGLILLAIIYIVSPFDLIPEAIFGPAGFIDDAIVLAYVIKRVLKRFKR